MSIYLFYRVQLLFCQAAEHREQPKWIRGHKAQHLQQVLETDQKLWGVCRFGHWFNMEQLRRRQCKHSLAGFFPNWGQEGALHLQSRRAHTQRDRAVPGAEKECFVINYATTLQTGGLRSGNGESTLWLNYPPIINKMNFKPLL